MANTQMERCPQPCNCQTSTGICGTITRGTGELSFNGYWEFPCTHGNAYSDYEPSTPAAPETPPDSCPNCKSPLRNVRFDIRWPEVGVPPISKPCNDSWHKGVQPEIDDRPLGPMHVCEECGTEWDVGDECPTQHETPPDCKGKTYLPPNWMSAPCGTDGRLCRKCQERAETPRKEEA